MVTAVVLAGGKGKRMQTEVPKQYLMLCGKPLLFYSLKAFEESEVDEIVLVVAPGEEEYCRQEFVEKYGFRKVRKIVPGGRERYESVWMGLQAAAEGNDLSEIRLFPENKENKTDIVLIHDGARPLITPVLIKDIISETTKYSACVVGMPVKDTIQMTDDNGVIVATPERKSLWNAQTPQAFSFSLAFQAYQSLMQEQQNRVIPVTDDAMVVRRFLEAKKELRDIRVHMIPGSYQNIKATTPDDLPVAEAFLKARENRK